MDIAQDYFLSWIEFMLTSLVPLHIANLPSSAVAYDANDFDTDILDEEEIYVRRVVRNFRDYYYVTKRKEDAEVQDANESLSKTFALSTLYLISKLCSRMTRIALSAPKALVLLLVPSILTNLPAEAESFNGISSISGNQNIQVAKSIDEYVSFDIINIHGIIFRDQLSLKRSP